jgi:hypothetical protein
MEDAQIASGKEGREKDRDRLLHAGRNRGIIYRNALAPRFTGKQGLLDIETD